MQQRPPRWSRSEASSVRGEADGAGLFGEQQVQEGLVATCDHPPSGYEEEHTQRITCSGGTRDALFRY